MCDFCIGKYKKIENGFCGDEIYLDENDILCFDNSGHEYPTGRININYCPMCGRDLKEGIFWSF